MRIAITGAHGVGKTTLTKLLATETGFAAPTPTPMHNPSPGHLKSLQNCTDEEVIRLSQRRYTERIVQEHSEDRVISDGSVLHEWVYASTRIQYGIFPATQGHTELNAARIFALDLLETFTEEALSYTEQAYDEIFFLPIEFGQSQEDAPISDSFQQIASEHLFALLSFARTPLHIIRGTPEERVQQVKAVLESSGTKFLQPAAR